MRPAVRLALALQKNFFPLICVLENGFPQLVEQLLSVNGTLEPVILQHDSEKWGKYLLSSRKILPPTPQVQSQAQSQTQFPSQYQSQSQHVMKASSSLPSMHTPIPSDSNSNSHSHSNPNILQQINPFKTFNSTKKSKSGVILNSTVGLGSGQYLYNMSDSAIDDENIKIIGKFDHNGTLPLETFDIKSNPSVASINNNQEQNSNSESQDGINYSKFSPNADGTSSSSAGKDTATTLSSDSNTTLSSMSTLKTNQAVSFAPTPSITPALSFTMAPPSVPVPIVLPPPTPSKGGTTPRASARTAADLSELEVAQMAYVVRVCECVCVHVIKGVG